jgi:hypothetical protein
VRKEIKREVREEREFNSTLLSTRSLLLLSIYTFIPNASLGSRNEAFCPPCCTSICSRTLLSN